MRPSASTLWSGMISGLALALFGLLAAGVSIGATTQYDNQIRSVIHDTASTYLTALANGVSLMGSLQILVPASVVIVIGLLLFKKRWPAAALSAAMGGALVLNWTLKTGLHRARPQPFFGVDPETFSFPSGHVLFASCFYGSLSFILFSRGKLSHIGWIVVAALVCAIGWSRVYLGVHYPSDVAAGLLVAIFWLGAIRGLGMFRLA
jgi:undecaprenyl-diphosphatase